MVPRRRPRCSLTEDCGAVIGHSSAAWRVTGPDRRLVELGQQGLTMVGVELTQRLDRRRRVCRCDQLCPADIDLDRKGVPPLPARGALSVGRPNNPTAGHSRGTCRGRRCGLPGRGRVGEPGHEGAQCSPVDDSIRRWAGPAPGSESSAEGQQAHVDTRQLPALRPIEEIQRRLPAPPAPRTCRQAGDQERHGKGLRRRPPRPAATTFARRIAGGFGSTQCHVRLLHDRKGAAHLDENPCDRRVLVAGVPSHDDVADSPDSHARGIADGAAENVGDRYHPVSKCPVESEAVCVTQPTPDGSFPVRPEAVSCRFACRVPRRETPNDHDVKGYQHNRAASGNTASRGR